VSGGGTDTKVNFRLKFPASQTIFGTGDIDVAGGVSDAPWELYAVITVQDDAIQVGATFTSWSILTTPKMLQDEYAFDASVANSIQLTAGFSDAGATTRLTLTIAAIEKLSVV
jgi:hypothetical protein